MTSHSQSNFYYNNENDALSCNSRPISSTLHRDNSNEQYKNNADIYSYNNTNIYDTSNGSNSGTMDIVMQRKSYESGSDVYMYNKDVNRDGVNTYGSDMNVLLQSGGGGATTTTKSNTLMNMRSDYSNGSGYSNNDNLSEQNQLYNSYTNDMMMYKHEGDVNSTAYCYNTPLSTISGDNTVAYNNDASGYTTGNWETTRQNDEYLYGRHKTNGSTKVLPRLPIKQSSSMLDGWNAYDDKEMQLHGYVANIPLTTTTTTNDKHLCATDAFNTVSYASAAPACSITDTTMYKTDEDFVYSGMQSLRLLPQLHSNQEYGKGFHRKLIDDDNIGAMMTSSSTATTLTTSTNLRVNTYDNTTIIKNYGDIYDDSYFNRTHVTTASKYNGSMSQRPYEAITTQNYMAYDGYNTTYNNAYNNSNNTGDSLSTCSDKTPYTAAVAQKLQLQQQRKYAIMMAMTTASVIASGETRVPVKRNTASDAHTKSAAGGGATIETLAYKAPNLGAYDVLSNKADYAWERTNECKQNNKALTKSALLSATTSTACNMLHSATSVACTTTHLTMETPTTLTVTTSTRKLPKRLPTPKPKSNNNNSNCQDKANGANSKKLPKLPIDKATTAAGNGSSVLSHDTVEMRDALAKPISIIETTKVQTANAIVTTTSALPPLTIDTFSVATTCVESIPSSTSTASTSTSSSTLTTTYSPTYTPYSYSITATMATSNAASVVTDFAAAATTTNSSLDHLTTATTLTSSTAKKSESAFVNGQSSSYISIYNNNNTVCKYDFVKENSNSNSYNNNNNNSVIVSPTATARKLSSATTIPTTHTMSTHSGAYPLYTADYMGYATNSVVGSNIDDSITLKHTNAYDIFLQTTTTCKSTNSPLSTPTKIIPTYTCSTVDKATPTPTTDAIKGITIDQSSSVISPIIRTTTPTTTTNQTMLFTAYSSDKVKPSYSLSINTDTDTNDDDDTGLKYNKALHSVDFQATAADTTQLHTADMFSTSTMSSIYDEYLKNTSANYLLTTATTLTTSTTLATDSTTLAVTCVAPTCASQIATMYDTFATKPYTLNTVAEIATTASTIDINDAKLTTTTTTLLPQTLEPHVTCADNFQPNDSHSIITTTPPTIITTTNNNVGRLLTTTVELANMAVTTTASVAISSNADITTTTYTDYLAKYPLSAVLMNDGSSSNSSNNNVGDRELPSYITEFLNCDTTTPNISDSLSKYDEMLQQFDSLDTYTLPTTLTPADTTAAQCVSSVESVTTTDVNKYLATTYSTNASDLAQSTVTDNVFATAAATTTTSTTTTSNLYSVDSITFSYPTMATILNDNNDADIKTAMPASVTAPSLTTAFDDTFYDSYNVDWSALTAPVTSADMNAETLANTTTTTYTSYAEHDMPTTSVATSISVSGGTQGNYYRPAGDSATRKSIPSATTTVAETATPPTLSVTGKATSMFGGISKGLKDGLGVLSSVNTTSDTVAKQQPTKKSAGFGFGLASKFVPNVGGLFAGTTASSGVINKSTTNSNLTATATTSTTANAVSTLAGCSSSTSTSNSGYGLYGSTTAATTAIDDNYGQEYSCAVNSKYSEPLYTNCHSDNMTYPFDISVPLHAQIDDVQDSANVDNNDAIMYMQLPVTSVAVTSDITENNRNTYAYDVGYDVADVARITAVSVEYGNEYAADMQTTTVVDDMQNVSYASQISDKMHVGVVDGSMINTTAYLNNDMPLTYYHTQQQINSNHTPQQQSQQQQEVLSNSSLQNSATCTKKSASPLIPEISNLISNVSSQRASTLSSKSSTPKLPTQTVKATKPSTGSGGGGMFGSFLGKAAAAVQSATQAVNQATTSVQQKAATVIPSSTTETTAVTTATTIITTSAAAVQKIAHQDSMPSPSHYTAVTAFGEDYDNSNLYEAVSIVTTGNNAVTVTDTATLHYNNYYLSGNQSQLQTQQQQQQSCKLLPSVPTAGSTGKKLPTINSSKSGFLIKQQPTEIYDDDLIIDLVNDTNEYHLHGYADENNDLFDDDNEIVDVLNDNNLSNVDDDDNELDRYIVEDRIGRELSHKQQSLQQIQPNYEIDSEQANYYTDPQLQETPSDLQQNVSQHQSRHSAVNSYYEHTDGGYDYREDYFNEEDEYKYLEKEQEILCQQQQQNSLKQTTKQQNYQYEDSSDIYLEDTYQSEDSGNYLDESSSSSVVGGPSKKQPLQIAETPTGAENGEVVNDLNTLPTTPTIDNFTGINNGNIATLSSSHQYQIKKQDSIIMEEDEDNILLNDIGVNKSTQPNSRRSSHESIIENGDDIMCELPSMPVAAPKKKMLIRGETEEVVSGHLHMLRKPEVTAKQRWHWAYNKIIMQLNNIRQSQSDKIKSA